MQNVYANGLKLTTAFARRPDIPSNKKASIFTGFFYLRILCFEAQRMRYGLRGGLQFR
jgi:hypothetical protein